MDYATALADLEDAAFAADTFGRAATFTSAATGEQTALTAILSTGVLRQDPQSASFERYDEIQVRVSELAAAPERGDRVVIGSETYIVDQWEHDYDATIYRCVVNRREASA